MAGIEFQDFDLTNSTVIVLVESEVILHETCLAASLKPS